MLFRSISVWDMTTGKERAALKANSGLRVGTVLFSTDDKVLAVSSSPAPTEAELGLRDEVRLWDTATLKELCALQTNQLDVSIALASDGKTLASADRTIKLWSVATGKELRSLNGGGVALAFSPGEGKTLLSAGSGGTIKWWDVATGKEQGIIQTHRQGPSAVFRAYAFSPDSQLLASVSGEIELWDVPEMPR